MATELAKAYVQIVPSTEGIKGELSKSLGGEATSAGKEAGKKSGGSFVSSMAKTLAGGAAAVGAAGTALVSNITKGASEVAGLGDKIDKASQKLGMSAQAYQEWDYVLNLAGTSMDNMSAGMKTLTNRLDEAANGGENAQAMFEMLGISLDDINSMSREDLFAKTIEGFQGMADSTERAALATDIFGKAGQELTPLFNQSAEATQAQIDLANEYGMVMGDDMVKASAAFLDSQTTLQNTLGGIKNRMLGEFLPALTQVSEGLAAFLAGDDSGLDKMQEGITGFIDSLTNSLPKVMEFGSNVIMAIGSGIIQNLPSLFSTVTQLMSDAINFMVNYMPFIVQVGMDLIVQFANGIVQAVPTLMPTMIQVVFDIAQQIIQSLPTIVETGIEVIQALVQGVIDAIPILVENIPPLIDTAVDTILECLPMLIECAIELVVAITQALPDIITTVINILPDLIESIVEGLIACIPMLIECAVQLTVAVVKALPQIFMAVVNALVKLVKDLAAKVKERWPEFKAAAQEWLAKIWIGIQEKWGTLIQNIINFFKQIPQKIAQALANIKEVGRNLVQGLWNGITNVTGWVLDKIRGFGQSILNGIKRIFGIGSPSKEMAYFGEMLDAGLAKGIEGNTRPISNAIDDITTMTTRGFSSTVGVQSALSVDHTASGMDQLIYMVAALAEKVDHLQVWLDGDTLVGGISERMDGALGVANTRKARGLA